MKDMKRIGSTLLAAALLLLAACGQQAGPETSAVSAPEASQAGTESTAAEQPEPEAAQEPSAELEATRAAFEPQFAAALADEFEMTAAPMEFVPEDENGEEHFTNGAVRVYAQQVVYTPAWGVDSDEYFSTIMALIMAASGVELADAAPVLTQVYAETDPAGTFYGGYLYQMDESDGTFTATAAEGAGHDAPAEYLEHLERFVENYNLYAEELDLEPLDAADGVYQADHIQLGEEFILAQPGSVAVRVYLSSSDLDANSELGRQCQATVLAMDEAQTPDSAALLVDEMFYMLTGIHDSYEGLGVYEIDTDTHKLFGVLETSGGTTRLDFSVREL